MKIIKTLKFIFSIFKKGYLKEYGWWNAYYEGKSIGVKHEELPWVSYPFIDFIKERLNKNLEIFEFGSGNSTLFYSKYCKNIYSVEHNKNWYKKLVKKLPTNVSLNFIEDKFFANSILNTNKKYDIIIIDSLHRIPCIKNAITSLKDIGVIILDDAERKRYEKAYQIMKKNNFKNIKFYGIAPGQFFKKCTTIFYKNNNCLDI